MNRIHTFMYVSYISMKKFFIPSSFLLSCTITNLMWLAVTNADTNHWLNLSTHLRYILLLFHMCSSTKSRAACAMNWLRCLWSSFWNMKNRILLPKQTYQVMNVLWLNHVLEPCFLHELHQISVHKFTIWWLHTKAMLHYKHGNCSKEKTEHLKTVRTRQCWSNSKFLWGTWLLPLG
jgi:hypothetical protein